MCFDMLKFLSVVIYQATVCIYFAYYRTSRFSNIYMKDMFFLFMIARPIFIVLYTTATAIFNIQATYYQVSKIRTDKLDSRNKKRK